MRKEKPGLITFGLGGNTIYFETVKTPTGSTSSRLEGYDSPEDFERKLEAGEDGRGRSIAEAYGELAGVPVFDGTPAYESKAGFRLAISSPMPEPGIESPERFSDIPGVSESLLLSAFRDHGDAQQKGLAALADAAIANAEFSGLDKLPVSLWLAWHRKHSAPYGARLGHVSEDGRSIIWA